MKRTRTRVLSFEDIYTMRREAIEMLWIARLVCAVASAMISATIGIVILVATLNVDVTLILTAVTFIGLMLIMEKYTMNDEKRKLSNANKLVKFINSDEEEITIIE